MKLVESYSRRHNVHKYTFVKKLFLEIEMLINDATIEI